ncbi:carbohydrate porin [Spirulina sp. CS-785/01]|nr:carbohydrate porin [Spirulina sp. CS-785/01]MDB9313707.1 carbohydrate porin [Spirulina sp. CS-785/01]
MSLDVGRSLTQVANQLGLNAVPRVDAFVENGSELVFGGRARLDFTTSFTGRDRLLIRIAETNLFPFTANSFGRFRAPAFPPVLLRPVNAPFTGNTGETAQTFNLDEAKIGYFFPVGSAKLYIAATGGHWHDITPTLSGSFQDFDGGNGALSVFATESPIYRIGGGAGAAFHLPLTEDERAGLTLGYLAGPGASDASRGVFNGEYAALGQVHFGFGDLDVGLTIVIRLVKI